MIPGVTLSLTVAAHSMLCRHLFPGDGKEAAAILICSQTPAPRQRLLVRDVLLVPHGECSRRTEHALTWPGSYIEQAIDKAQAEQLSLILLHSHPTNYSDFSVTDDESDLAIMPCLFEAINIAHGTAVMLPNGFIFSRLYETENRPVPIDLVSVAGDDLHYWWYENRHEEIHRPMAFASGMTSELSRLTACVIGVSGTGSVIAEQACRLGFGRVIGIDDDHVELKNLNRILNTVKSDAERNRSKVQVFSDRVNHYRDIPYFTAIHANMFSREAVLAASQADVVFCCVDTLQARMLADRLAASFLLPLFDVGVTIPTRMSPHGLAIAEVTGRIDYVQPGGSSLGDRGIYTPATLQAEALSKSDPEAHADQVRAGYIQGSPEEAPSVIALNMRAASACMMEFIARAYPFRHEPNANYARTKFMLAEGFEESDSEASFCSNTPSYLARGCKEPLLGLPSLSQET